MDILLILILILFTSFALGAFFDAPWAPTVKGDFDRIAELAGLKEGMLLYELGSGTGALLFYLSGKYKIHCVGIEVAPLFYLYSKIKSLFYKNVNIKYGNFYNHDLSRADAIFAYLMPKTLNKLREKIKNEAKSDVKIIISCWGFENIKPLKISEMNRRFSYYLYDKKSI
jgi:hypothetical protein